MGVRRVEKGQCDPAELATQSKEERELKDIFECMKLPAKDIDKRMVHTTYKWYMEADDDPSGLVNPKVVYKTLHTKSAEKFCGVNALERLKEKTDPQGSRTCKDFDVGGKVTVQYCKEKDRLNPRKGADDGAIKCTQRGLGEAVWRKETEEYCKKNPGERYCSCYNIVSGVCEKNSGAQGCKAVAMPKELADENALGQENYDKLMKTRHCRAAMCSPQNYVPKQTPACPDTIEICGKEFHTGTTSNGQMIRQCVVGQGGMSEEEIEDFLSGDVPEIGKDWTKKKKKKTAKQQDTESLMLATMSALACCCCVIALAAVASSRKS